MQSPERALTCYDRLMKLKHGKPKHRRSEITDLLRQHGGVSVEVLAARFNTSVETIRRDLGVLSAAGKLQRTHGGAILPALIGEDTFQKRMRENVSAKRTIAQKASELISPGDTLFIDAGSTTLMLAEELVHIDKLTVITNSTQIVGILGSQKSIQLFLIGGTYNSESSAADGQMAIEQLGRFRADLAFVTIGGIDVAGGAMDFDLQEAELARVMIARAGKAVVLADAFKFNRSAPFEVASRAEIDYFVSEKVPDLLLLNVMLKAGVSVIAETKK